MTQEFGAAMRRALTAVRGGDVSEATSIIQQALGGGGQPEAFGRMRRPLREVVRTLREGRRRFRPSARPAPVAEPAVADGATFLEAVYAEAAGSRRYRLYRPASLDGGAPQGLVLMLHGCTQTPEDFAAGHADERARRDPPAARRLPRADADEQRQVLLELVPPRRPGPRRRRAGDPRGAGAAAGGRPRRTRGPGLRRRAVGRRGDGGGARGRLPRRLRGRRRALRRAARQRQRRALGLRGDARRARARGGAGRAAGAADRVPWRRRRHRAPGERRAARRRGTRDRGAARRARRGRRPGLHAAGRCAATRRRRWSTGWSRAPGTPGRAATRQAAMPTARVRTPRRRWCGSSLERRSIAPFGAESG